MLSNITITGQTNQGTFKLKNEIAVNSFNTIILNTPKSIGISGNGPINSRQIEDKYIVSRNDNSPIIYSIDKNLAIQTWNKDSIRIISEIALKCKTKQQEESLRNALILDLNEQVNGNIEINCELNIYKFNVEHGWFRKENNHITLNNGQDYPIEYLGISTTIYIPTNTPLIINSYENDILLKEFTGELTLNMQGGKFKAKNISNLQGDVQFGKLEIKNIKEANLRLKQTSLKAKSIGDLELRSSISKISIETVNNLKLYKSINDKFYINTIHALYSRSTSFSDFNIELCKGKLDMDIKNGDIEIQQISQELDFLLLKNTNATINIGIENILNFTLKAKHQSKSKFTIPSNATLKKAKNDIGIWTIGKNPDLLSLDIDCPYCEINIH